MKKKEAIYLHVLLTEVREYMTERGSVRDEDFTAYDALQVNPIRFDLSKGEHEAALLCMVDEFAQGLGDRTAVAA